MAVRFDSISTIIDFQNDLKNILKALKVYLSSSTLIEILN